MRRRRNDPVGMVAVRFVLGAATKMHAKAESAIECSRLGSALGVRQNLTSLRRLAVRSERIERRMLSTSSSTARLQRATDAALEALDGASPARRAHALERIATLAPRAPVRTTIGRAAT